MAELAKVHKQFPSSLNKTPPNERLRAITKLYKDSELASLIMQLKNAADLETTKMCLSLLNQLEATYQVEVGRAMTESELSYALDAILKDDQARASVVQLYQEQKHLRLGSLQQRRLT